MIETYRGTVYPWQCDHMGHMNIQHYTAKFDEATWQLFGMIGLTPEYLKSRGRGMAAVDQKTRYLSELLPGDLVTISSEIIEMGGRTIRFHHIMKKSNTHKIAAETEFVGVHIDTRSRKSCEFEEDILQCARNHELEDSHEGACMHCPDIPKAE